MRAFVRGMIYTFIVALVLPARAEPVVTVFAAASLTDAVTSATDLYRGKSGIQVRTSFASSSTLARQIEAGAEAQIYISANPQWMDYLDARRLIVPGTRRAPIGNDLVLIAPAESAAETVDFSSGLSIAHLLGARGWLALGDPAHVPAGAYAKQALKSLEQWQTLTGRLAFSDNVRGALALVARGEAALGVVYGTDVLITTSVKAIATFPADAHAPITYPFAIVAGHDGAHVRNLFGFLTGPQGVEVFESFGFVRR